jgi:hypothetical protein
MKSLLYLLLFLSPAFIFAQDNEWKEASPESAAYHKYRLKNTVPPYGLEKVKALMAKMQPAGNEQRPLAPKEYMSLSAREKFTYHMIHAETYSQNCDVMPPIQDEHKKIFGHLPDAFDEAGWSERQLDFLVSNKDSVFALIKESVNRTNRVGLNYKWAIVEANGLELIPFLVQVYKKDHKDLDILTVLLLLMKENKYEPFMSSSSNSKLYTSNNYQSYLQYSTANEELILKRAMDFFNSIN